MQSPFRILPKIVALQPSLEPTLIAITAYQNQTPGCPESRAAAWLDTVQVPSVPRPGTCQPAAASEQPGLSFLGLLTSVPTR